MNEFKSRVRELQLCRHLQKQLEKLETPAETRSSTWLLSKKILFMHCCKFEKLQKFHNTARAESRAEETLTSGSVC